MIFYIARQPILDANKKLIAYELLFRDGFNNAFPSIDSNEATARLVENSEFSSGISSLTANNKAFINFTEQAICSQLPQLLPKHAIVVELLESIEPTDAVFAAVTELKQRGYTIALDDFEFSSPWARFLPYIDIIKIDFRALTVAQIKQQMSTMRGFEGRFLAEKIESYQEYEQAQSLGFDYFQGYFFAKPEVIQRRSLSVSQKVYLNLLQQTTAPQYNPAAVTAIIEQDTGLSFKLLRFVNSAFFARGSEITSLKQAVVRLGQQEIRKFVAIVATACLSDQKPDELTRLSIIRARFCELLAMSNKQYGSEQDTAFLAGLLSNIDAIMDDELAKILMVIHAGAVIYQALIDRQGAIGCFITTVEAIEQADWPLVKKASQRLKINNNTLLQAYYDACAWAEAINKD